MPLRDCNLGAPVRRRFAATLVATLLATATLGGLAARSSAAEEPSETVERLLFDQAGRRREVVGRRLVEAADGGVLTLAPDGQIWPVRPTEIVSRETLLTPFAPLPADALAKSVLNDLPPGFDVHTTKHYLIFHNTSDEYARWCGALFERLHAGFTSYWTQRDFPLREPEFPLVAIVFADQASYVEYAKAEVGESARDMFGYYSFRTNHIVMYDLTGADAVRAARPSGGRSTVDALLSHPAAERTVATIIHEAAHQIAFNSGLQTRYADNPLWLSEGLAMFIETPDLRGRSGWRTIGAVNQFRLQHFQSLIAERSDDSLATLLSDDARMRDGQRVQAAYSEAWALTYFLMKTKSEAFGAYMKTISAKPRLIWDSPETRLQEFRDHFGGDLKKLDREFVGYIKRLKP